MHAHESRQHHTEEELQLLHGREVQLIDSYLRLRQAHFIDAIDGNVIFKDGRGTEYHPSSDVRILGVIDPETKRFIPYECCQETEKGLVSSNAC